MIEPFKLHEAVAFALTTSPHDATALSRVALLAKHAVDGGGRWWMHGGCSNSTVRFTIASFIDDHADDFIDALGRTSGRVELLIDSEGGNSVSAIRVARFLAQLDSSAIVHCASSAAAILAAGCRRVGIVADGSMMIHAPRRSCFGTAKELRQAAEHLEGSTSAGMRALLQARAKVPVPEVETWLTDGNDHRFDAAGAVAAGLADYILPELVTPEMALTAAPEVAAVDAPVDRLALTLARALRVLPVHDRDALSEMLSPLVRGYAALAPSRE